MSDYSGSSFISQPVEEELTGLTTLINENKDANSATQAQLEQEIYDRGAADNNLQNQINDAASSGALSAEITARIDGDTNLGNLITNNTNSIGTINANVAQEIINRTNADNVLQADIDSRATQAALTEETTIRIDRDNNLGLLILNNLNAIDATNTNLNQEITNRTNADTALQTDIDTRATTNALTTETNARIAADATLSNSIATNTTAIATTNTNLGQEITDRQSADTGLQNQINDRALTFSLNNEITARTDADTQLQSNINFEASQRQYYISNLQGQINVNETAITTEETARTNADNVLQASITANATAITNKANDTDVVKLTGDQNIAGEKFFTNDTRIGGDVILPTDEGKIVFGANNDRKIYWTAEGLGTNQAFRATRYDVAGGQQIASNNLADGDTLVKLLDGTVAIDGDVNLTAGKAYKINDVSIPTHADLDLKAPIDNADLTGHTQMDRLTVNHSDSATIGLDFNNTNSNQYAGKFNTAAYGWRMFNNNTGLSGNTTFGVYTKGTGSQLNPLLVKNDGKVYTLDQEVDGDVNLSAGHEYKIDNVPIPTNTDLALKAPIDNASLTGNTQMTRLTVNHSDSASVGLDFNNTNVNQYAGAFNTAAYGWRFFNDNTSLAGNTTFSVNTKGSGAVQTPLLVKNDGKLYTLDQEVDGDVNLTTGHEFKINGVPLSSGGMTPEQEAQLASNTTRVDNIYNDTAVELSNITLVNNSRFDCTLNRLINVQNAMDPGQIPQVKIQNLVTDLESKRDITNNLFSQLNLNGTTQYMTASGGTINGDDYFCEFDLTGLVNTDLVVGIAETNVYEQTKCIFIKTEDASNQTGNLIIRSNYLLTDQDIILRKKGDCVFLHADWDSSKWKVLGVFSNVQQTLTTTGNIVSETDILCKRHLFSNADESTYIDGFTTINLRTPTGGTVPSINIDGQEAFMTKATNQTITGVKTFENGIITDEVVTEAAHNLLLKTADAADNVIIDNGSVVGLTQTSTKTSLNRALNIPYASVLLGTGVGNADPPTGSVSGDIYRSSANALHIVP